VTIDDGWFRDSGPTFVLDGHGSRLGIDWDFNGWGGRFPSSTTAWPPPRFSNRSASSASRHRWYWKVVRFMSTAKAP